MAHAYHYQTYKVIPGGHGRHEQRHELLSEYFQTAKTAMSRLNSSLTLLKGDDNQCFSPIPVAVMEASLRDENLFWNTVFLADGCIRAMSITQFAIQ